MSAESRTTIYRNRVQEIENLQAALFEAQRESEKINDVSQGLIRDLKSMQHSYELLKQQNDKLQNVSNELKQENAELKQQREMFQTRCELLERERNSRSGLLKSPKHILIVLCIFLAANVWHNANGYSQAGGNLFFGLLVVLSIDLAVLTFVRNGMKTQAGLYSFGTFVITFLSFNPDLFAFQNYVISGIFAAGFSYGIYAFSELFENKN